MTDVHEEAAKLIVERFSVDIAVARGMAGAVLEAHGALQFNLAAEEACRHLVAWFEDERKGPDYGSLTRDTHPDGERIWSQWWVRQHRLCGSSEAAARRALSLKPAKL